MKPSINEVPYSGGIVGVSGYDVVRLFENIPKKTQSPEKLPQAIFVIPTSV